MDPDRTGVVTFEVSKLDNFWWKVEIFELLLNVKHNIFFQLTGKLASKWQRSRKPHSCHIRTKGSLGEVLLSGTGFQFVLSLDFIWFYYSVFILFQDFAAGLAVLQRGRWIYVQLSKLWQPMSCPIMRKLASHPRDCNSLTSEFVCTKYFLKNKSLCV